MTRYVKKHLGVKLFLSYFVVILIAGLVLNVATRFALQPAFNRHLGQAEASQGTGQGSQQGKGSELTMDERLENRSRLYQDFQNSFNEALSWSALAAGIAALLTSLYLSRRVTIPLRAMTAASQRIAEGDYDERVQEENKDELGQLAHSFNRMAEKLEKVEEMRRQLIGNVAHELRTPLTTIKGTAEALEDGVMPATAETYQLIWAEAERLNHLVNDLQELSRVEADAYELDIALLHFSDVVETIKKRFSQQFKEKKIDFLIQIPQDLPSIQADEARLVQVLTNLLANAMRYTPEGGEVKLTVAQLAEEIQVTVQDNGTGIPEEHLENIFTRFYRVDKSRSREAGGSGIGLAICKHLVEAHGGKIWAESAGAGKGSAFILNLPL